MFYESARAYGDVHDCSVGDQFHADVPILEILRDDSRIGDAHIESTEAVFRCVHEFLDIVVFGRVADLSEDLDFRVHLLNFGGECVQVAGRSA